MISLVFGIEGMGVCSTIRQEPLIELSFADSHRRRHYDRPAKWPADTAIVAAFHRQHIIKHHIFHHTRARATPRSKPFVCYLLP